MKPLLYLLLLSCLFYACRNEIKNEVDQSRVGKIKSVLILGNSIVQHGPRPEIGWNHNWGMAASAMDSDFVHRLISAIRHADATVKVRFTNIAGFETHYTSFDLAQLDSLKDPDLLIMRIGENVNGEMVRDSNFIYYYDSLINYLDPQHHAVRLIVDGFLQNPSVNKLVCQYAVDHKFPFISITDLSADSTNTAKGKFSNLGVALHPSDKGMRMIEERIWMYIRNYF